MSLSKKLKPGDIVRFGDDDLQIVLQVSNGIATTNKVCSTNGRQYHSCFIAEFSGYPKFNKNVTLVGHDSGIAERASEGEFMGISSHSDNPPIFMVDFS